MIEVISPGNTYSELIQSGYGFIISISEEMSILGFADPRVP